MIRYLLPALLLASVALAVPVARPIRVGVGHPPPAGLRAATAPGGSLTVDWQQFSINKDGSASIALVYLNASGTGVSQRLISVNAGCTSAHDNLGNDLGAPPAVLCTALSNMTSGLTSFLTNAAAAGKVNL